MTAIATSVSANPARAHTRRLLVRMNSTLFHCLGAAVLLEFAAAARAAREQAGSIRAQEQEKRAQWLRGYAASIWPEFGWEAACEAIGTGHAPHCAERPASAAAARDHMTAFYRALASIAEDPELCRVLKNIASTEEARLAHMGVAGSGALAALRNIQFTRGYVEHTRNRVVRRAFDLLQQHWTDTPPFPAIDYDAFLSRAYALLAPHLRLDWTRRLLYRGWLVSRPLCAAASATSARGRRSPEIGTPAYSYTRGSACALPVTSDVR